jgi:hypothetical protein
MTQLTAQRVNDLFKECIAGDDGVRVEGIVNIAYLKVTGHEDEIGQLLAELPEPFQITGGGGWTFLNACDDRHGNHWTGLHQTMEQLFLLGMAAGKARWALPRDMWSAFPGGMPYVTVAPDGFPEPKA